MVIAEIAASLIFVVTALIVAFLLLLVVVSLVDGVPMRSLAVHMAKRQMREIKRRTVRQMFDAEARYRAEHPDDDIIDGSVADD